MTTGPEKRIPEVGGGIERALSGEPGEPVATVLEPLRLRNAAEQIADRLVTAIALGEFVPGQRLPTERELEAMLDINRRSIRDAIHELAGAGYVEIRRGRNGGAYVRAAWGPRSAEMVRRTLLPNWKRFEWLFDLRRLIEPLIARTAADRYETEDEPRIREALAEYLAAENDREASRAADQALHTAIAQATQNPYLARLSMQLRAEVSLGFQAEPFSAASWLTRCSGAMATTRRSSPAITSG
jgi:GntR family transcriptional regulator, transcriptional repressor for pyruvate dehydrogenase complex